MAIKASATITLFDVVDIDSTTWYYRLQSSTAAVPAKPTTATPSGWTTTEPTYTEGSTDTLYTVMKTTFSDGSFEYTPVSKSTSYEAAKAAYNKAQNAQNTADSIPNYVASRGENLVTNGTCLLGNNQNFSGFTYDGSDTYYAGGSFKTTTVNFNKRNDEFIPVDIDKKYTLLYYIKCNNASARFYDLIASYDIDKKEIMARHIMWMSGSTTTLARDLKNGDTVVHLTNASGFNTSTTYAYQRGLIFWNYKNSKGYQYETETYSRNVWENLWSDGSAIDKTANTITLDSAWSHGTFTAGTPVSQCSDVGTYIYLNSSYTIPANTWTRKSGSLSGIGKNNEDGKFREGTAFIKIGWLGNREVTSATAWFSTISFTQCINSEELNDTVNEAVSSLGNTIDGSLSDINDSLAAIDDDLTDLSSSVDAANTILTEMSTEFNQSNEAFEMRFTDLTTMIQQIGEETTSETTLREKYIRFVDGVIVIGEVDSPFQVKISNERIDFTENENAIAYISNSKLYINEAEIVVDDSNGNYGNLTLGKFEFIPRPSGNLSFRLKK